MMRSMVDLPLPSRRRRDNLAALDLEANVAEWAEPAAVSGRTVDGKGLRNAAKQP